ncbi:MAG: ABC transporter permease, partial [Pseudomonadota bacterium]|nr:ABC transporter permease [Pseudomonadota bacterium]
MLRLLAKLSWPEVRHHPWRTLAALLAVVLGVALAFSVQLINQSALGEFSAAVRGVNGEPDFELRSQADGFDEAFYTRVAQHPSVAIASPVVEIETSAFDRTGQRSALRVVGIDALVAGSLAPALMPRPQSGNDRFVVLDPARIFLNPQAARRFDADGGGSADSTASTSNADKAAERMLRVQTRQGDAELRISGYVTATGPALAVMDIAGAQATFGWLGRLSRIDVRLVPGADRTAVLRELALPAGIRAAAPDEAAQRISNVSRAYRVNLTVLALVALFTGAFLVFSILSLSVAKRQPQLALLGVLGLGARERLQLV